MQVYVEYALLENFCMDFTLLYAAKAAVNNPAGYIRIAVSSVLGACFAVVFPLFGLGGTMGVAVKIASGLALVAVAGKFASFKHYAKYVVAFDAFTFLLGGALIALFTVANISYSYGQGYIATSVPVGIPIFGALLLALAANKLRKRLARSPAGEANCRIFFNGKSVSCKCFYDSGNNVYRHGAPVSVIPRHVALRLIDVGSIKEFAKVHTVSGDGELPLFKADKICVDDGEHVSEIKGAYVAVSKKYMRRAVLHQALTEAACTKNK